MTKESTHPSKWNVLAIIPARGGSKGIPRKNLALVNGLPLVAHSIGHALASTAVTRTIVSTDDEEIADLSLKFGAEVPFLRPAALAGDHVLDLPVFQHVLEELRQRESYLPDVVVHLRPTTPYRRIEWIGDAIQLLVENPVADSVRSVSHPNQHPYRMFRLDDHNFLEPLMRNEHPTPYLLRRQDLPPLYYYNCVLDVTRPSTIFEKQSMTGDKILAYVIPADEVIDVDTNRDLQVARFLFENLG
jgi:N-acylneuraminate cytidylyltransferase